MKKIFRISEIARICSVERHVVGRWFDAGRLKGFWVPPDSHDRGRRVNEEDLVAFLKEHINSLGTRSQKSVEVFLSNVEGQSETE